jgi:hypothetical protein
VKNLFKSGIVALLLLSSSHAFASYGSELKHYEFGVSALLHDKNRPRLYCAIPNQNSLAVIDSESLEVIATIFTGSQPTSLAQSLDGFLLFVGNSGSSAQGVAVVNLEKLEVTKHISTTTGVRSVAAGLGVIYTIESDAIRAYTVSSGTAIEGRVSTYTTGVFVYGGNLSLTADGKTLAYYQTGLSPSSWHLIDVSNWPGTSTKSNTFGSSGQALARSPDGKWLTFVSGAPYYVSKHRADDPNSVVGTFNTGAYPRAAHYSPDSNTLFTVNTTNRIDAWNANTFVKTATINTSGDVRYMACDRVGKVLFAGTSSALRVYFLETQSEEMKVEINRAVEIRWNSTYGALYQVEWAPVPLPNANWQKLGGTILGTGLTMSVYDSTRNARNKFYRVRTVE